MHIHEPVGGDFSWDGNAHPAKYGIMLPLSHDETLSFDMELPKHTTLIDLHERYTPDDVVKANLYENVCAAFKRLTV